MNCTIQRMLLPFLIALLLAGCAGMNPTGYLDDYSRLKSGSHLEKVWRNTNKRMASTSVIVLSNINTERIHDEKGVTVTDVVLWLRQSLQKYAQSESLKIVFDDSEKQSGYFLELAVTQMTPGSSATRIWVGELGAGHAKVQIEGKLLERDGNIVIAFSDLRSNSGAIGLKDLGGDAGPQLVKDNVDTLSKAIVMELKEYMQQ